MAIDTALKRLSVLQLKMPWRMTLPFPSGAVTNGDRYTLALSYAGSTFIPVTGGVNMRNYRLGMPGKNSRGYPGLGGQVGP